MNGGDGLGAGKAGSVPAGATRQASGWSVQAQQHIALAAAVCGRHHAGLFQAFHQPDGAVIAHLQLALQMGDRGFVALPHQGDGLVVQRVEHAVWQCGAARTRQAHRRLADVVVENQDFQTLIRHYDRPVTFFYCDPPYHATEGYYQNIGEDGFTERDHIRLRDVLMRIEGKFLLSYNDDAFIRSLYDRPGIYLMETTRINNIKQRYDNGAQFPELLIANYDLRERSRMVPSQMTLFDWNGGEAIG